MVLLAGETSETSHIPLEKDVYVVSDIYIYEPARIYLKNEATFGFDQDGD